MHKHRSSSHFYWCKKRKIKYEQTTIIFDYISLVFFPSEASHSAYFSAVKLFCLIKRWRKGLRCWYRSAEMEPVAVNGRSGPVPFGNSWPAGIHCNKKEQNNKSPKGFIVTINRFMYPFWVYELKGYFIRCNFINPQGLWAIKYPLSVFKTHQLILKRFLILRISQKVYE